MLKKKIYLDYASTTPLDKKVFMAMKPYFFEKFGNPGNLYHSGRVAKKAIDIARRKMEKIINCDPGEIIFNASATEADNLAILGIARANKKFGNKIIISNIEHKGIHSSARLLADEDFDVVEIPVGSNGLISPGKISKALDKKTILVSVTYADSETGTVQPIEKISKVIKKFRAGKGAPPYFHTDASQAFSYLDSDVKKLGVDAMTISAHKIYGPKGIAALYIRKGIAMTPVIIGGGQQNNLRSGTQNVPAIVGFAESAVITKRMRKKEYLRLKKLRDILEKGIFRMVPKVVLNGHPQNRLPNFLNVSFLDIEGEAALLYFDNANVEVSTGSACDSETLEPSRVLLALGRSYEHVHGSIRFSLGRHTTAEEIRQVLRIIPGIIKKLRVISPLDLKLNESKKISRPEAFAGGRAPHFLRNKK